MGSLKNVVSECSSRVVDFRYSFGYDCQKLFNLIVIDESTIAFSSGSFVHFLNTESNQSSFMKSQSDYPIGHITVNTKCKLLTIGENSEPPVIRLYEWPEMTLKSELKNGAQKGFQYLNFSPNGDLLASQSTEPDYLLTIWDWSNEKIVLRAQAYVNDVYKIVFSPHDTSIMTTCGRSHVKFWKMIDTFTGLKLKGELGRFGNKDICDIIATRILPDQTVLTGDALGNVLVWEGGLIRNQLQLSETSKGDQIWDILFEEKANDEQIMVTVSQFGKIETWNYNQIMETCLLNESENVILTEIDHKIKSFNFEDIQIKSIVPCNEAEWFVQDANGAVWKVNVGNPINPLDPKLIFKGHAAAINDIVSCPFQKNLLISVGDDSQLRLYDYKSNISLYSHSFQTYSCEKILWLLVDAVNLLLIAFGDGSLKLCLLNEDPYELEILQSLRSHSKSIIVLEYDTDNDILITTSDDCLLFFYHIFSNPKPELDPIGFIKLNIIVTCLKIINVNNDLIDVLVGSKSGVIAKINIQCNKNFQKFDEFGLITFEIVDFEIKYGQFESCKSRIRHEKYLEQFRARCEAETDQRIAELKKLNEESSDFVLDEEEILKEMEKKVMDEDLLFVPFFPKTPSQVLFVVVDETSSHFWLAMSDYDCGFRYEFDLKSLEMLKKNFDTIAETDDEVILTMKSTIDNCYVFYGTENGSIRVFDRQNNSYATLMMHNKAITKLELNNDEQILFSAGKDGNLFSYNLNVQTKCQTRGRKTIECFIGARCTPKYAKDEMPLEGLLQKERKAAAEKMADEIKLNMLEQLKNWKLRFEKEVRIPNLSLPSEFQIDISSLTNEKLRRHFEMWRNDALNATRSEIEYELEKSRIAYEKLFDEFIKSQDHEWPAYVETFDGALKVTTVRCRSLTDDLKKFFDEIDKRLTEEQEEIKRNQCDLKKRKSSIRTSFLGPRLRSTIVESFVCDLPENVLNNAPKLKRLLEKYQERKKYMEIRQNQWDEFKKSRPPTLEPGREVFDSDDLQEIQKAIDTIGDYKFKTDFEKCSKIANERFPTVLHKSKEIKDNWIKLNKVCSTFNEKIFEMIKKRNQLKGSEVQVLESEFRIRSKPSSEAEDQSKSVQAVNNEVIECKLDTEWYREKQEWQQLERDFEQERLKNLQQRAIEQFDEEVKQLDSQKKRLMVDVTLLKLHNLKLNQELAIIKKYENDESRMLKEIGSNERQLFEIEQEAENEKKELAIQKIELDQLKKSQVHIVEEFESLTLGNKFKGFLEKLFLARPSNCSSPAALDSESAASEDEQCPAECDPRVYALVFPLREKMQEIENIIETITESMSSLNAVIGQKSTISDTIKAQLVELERELFSVQKLKLEELNNKVYSVVILKLSQISSSACESPDDAILFSNRKLNQLSKRVGELKNETAELEEYVKSCKIEINKIDTECSKKEHELKILRNRFGDLVNTKFKNAIKSVRDLNEMDEFILRRMVHKMRLQHLEKDVEKSFEAELEAAKSELKEAKEKYSESLKKNTCRLELLAWLQNQTLQKVPTNDRSNAKSKKRIDYAALEQELLYLERVSEWQQDRIRSLTEAGASGQQKNFIA